MSAAKSRKILVTGATGQQGGAVTKHMLAAGWQVRALTRSPDKPAGQALAAKGVELVRGDLDDAASIERAVAGVQAVFSVQTFMGKGGVEAEERQGKALADAAKQAGVEHFVYSSVGGAERSTGVPHFESKWRIEEHVRALGLPWTILRPVMFMDFFRQSAPARAIFLGLLRAALGKDKQVQLIAVDDIGYFARQAFERPADYMHKAPEIAGDALTVPEIRAALRRTYGGLAPVLPIPRFALRLLPLEMRSMLTWFGEAGYQADLPALRAQHPGLATLDAFLRGGRGSDAAAAA
jgi:uncharacterized protein YbjT (DUF2867 family)